jgi:hypothetical protein
MPTPARAHRIEVACLRYGAKGAIYEVTFAGEVLIAACRNPEFDACRSIARQGITGRLEMWRSGRSCWDLAADIERGAGLTVRERLFHSERRSPNKLDVRYCAACRAGSRSVLGVTKRKRARTRRPLS